MALFSELDATISLDSRDFVRSARSAASASDEVGDEADEAADDVSAFGGAFGVLASGAVSSIAPTRGAAAAIDEVGDEAEESARAFGSLSAGSDGLRLSMGAISGSISSVVVGIGGLLAVLAPLVPVLGLAAGAVAGLAVAFGAILGTGILAFGTKRAKQNKQQLKQVKAKIKQLEELESTEKGLTKAQEKQLTALEEQAKTLEEGTTAMGGFSSALKEVWTELQPVINAFGQKFAPLIAGLLDSIVPFTKSLLDATGNLKPFVSALGDLGASAARILPKLLGLFVDVARTALPMFRQIGGFIAANLVPALDALFQAGRKAAGPVYRLGMALFELGKSLAPVAGVVGRVALALYDMAAVGIGALASGITSVVNAFRAGIGVFRRGAAVIGATFIPILSSLAGAWAGMEGRVSSVAASMAGTIQYRLVSTLQDAAAVVRAQLTAMSAWWTQHGAGVVSTINQFSTHAQEAVIQMMAAINAAFAAPGESEASFGYFFMESLRQMRAAAQVIGAQLPVPIQQALGLITGAVRRLVTQTRTQLNAARQLWAQYGTGITAFVASAITSLRQFAGMVRTAIAKPVQTFRTLRTELNALLPPFLQIQTTATQLGTAIKTKLLPALAASGLLGIATALAPVLSGPLLGAFTRLSGVGLRLATLFGGPLLSGLALLISPITRLGTMLTGTLLPAFASLTATVGGVLLSALTTIGSLVGGVILSAFTSLSALLSGGLLASLSGLAASLTSISGIMGILGTAVGALLSPLGLLAVAVGALYLAWRKNLFGIRDIGMKVFGALKSLISGDMMAAKNQFKQAVSMIGLSWRQNIKPLIASATRIFNRIKQVVGQAMRWLRTNAIQPALRGLTKLWRTHMGHIEEDTRQLRTFLTGILKVIGGAIAGFAMLAQGVWQRFGDEILRITKFVFNLVGSVIGGVLDGIFTAIDVITDLMVGDWRGALSAMSGLATRIFNGILNFVSKWAGKLVKWIADALSDAFDAFVQWGQDLIFGSLIHDIFNAIIDAVIDFAADFVAKIAGLVGDLVASAKELKRKFVNAIISMGRVAIKKAGKLVSGIMHFIGSLPRKALTVVNEMKRKFVNGIIDLGRLAIKKADKAVDAIINKLESIIGDAKEAGKGMAKAFTKGIKEKLNDAVEFVKDKMQAVRNLLPGSDAKTGPLSDLTHAGKMLPSTLAVGIRANADELRNATVDMAQSAAIPPAAAAVATTGGPGSGPGGSEGPDTVVVQLDGEATTKVMRGEAVEVVAENASSTEFSVRRGSTDRHDFSGA